MNFATYFQQYQNNFWEWNRDEEVEDEFSTGFNIITIPNTGTISYTAYAVEILKTLSENGLPPFGSYLLVLYAVSREQYRKIDGLIYFIKNKCEILNQNSGFKIECENAIIFLENILALDSEFKTGKNKSLLFNTIFRDAHYRISAADSVAILENIEIKFEQYDLSLKTTFNKNVFSRDLKVLHLLHQQFPTPRSLVHKMFNYTELEELSEDIATDAFQENDQISRDHDLLEDLIANPQTFYAGSLIKRIWSGLKIPMQNHSPADYPLGGISDITNKGNFDRMLLSEFANDDDVFITRIANDEVLYVERELAPEKNIIERILIIDASIKNWGTPKTLAFSTAIAIAIHPKSDADCTIFVAGDSIQEVSVDTVEDVLAGYTILSNQLSSANVIDEFLQNLSLKKEMEVFLLLSEDALKAVEMQKLLQENKNILRYVITSNAHGFINFYKYQNGTRKHIQKIVLPLKELWNKKREKSAVSDNKSDFPLIYPLLFPVKNNFIKDFVLNQYQYILTRSKTLIRRKMTEQTRLDDPPTTLGGEVIFENISIKNQGTFGLGITKNDDYLLAQYFCKQKKIFILNLTKNSFFEGILPSHFVGDEALAPVYFEESFYLYHSLNKAGLEIYTDRDALIINEISTLRNTIDELFHERLWKYKFVNYQNILTNIDSIAINTSNNIAIGKHEIFLTEDSMFLSKSSGDQLLHISSRANNTFTFSEGSTIILEKRGILIFTSHNPAISVFYMTCVIDQFIGVASSTDFSGFSYYLPHKSNLNTLEISPFYQKYFLPFIQNITDYGAED